MRCLRQVAGRVLALKAAFSVLPYFILSGPKGFAAFLATLGPRRIDVGCLDRNPKITHRDFDKK